MLNQYTDTWLEDYQRGLSTRKIAKKYGVGKSSVQKYLSQITQLRSRHETQQGAANSNWRGDNLTLQGLHKWVRGAKPKPNLCEKCNLVPPLDLANISPTFNEKTYTRDLKNWWWLCRSCHMIIDGRLERLHKNNIKIY